MTLKDKTSALFQRPKFSDLLASPDVKARWEKVRQYFYLRESTYDMSNRCNIRCDGCYYFEGDKQFAVENLSPEDWRALMRAEKARGIAARPAIMLMAAYQRARPPRARRGRCVVSPVRPMSQHG